MRRKSMHGTHAILDMHRIAQREALSARPHSPKRPDNGDREPFLDQIRMLITRALRRIADATEPRKPQAPAPVPVTSNTCH
jgi:hypothetical protein